MNLYFTDKHGNMHSNCKTELHIIAKPLPLLAF